MDASEILNQDQTGEMARTSAATLRYWRGQGTGPRWFRIGRRIVYRRSDVEAWIEAQYEASHPPGAA